MNPFIKYGFSCFIRYIYVKFSGSKAFKRLMKDAFEVRTRSQFYTKFVKYGSEEDAYHDFFGASPSMINDKAKTRAGVRNIFFLW